MTHYEKRYVAFIDILGFSDLVTRSINNEGIRLDLISLLTELEILTANTNQGVKKLFPIKRIQFSDSIVLSCDAASSVQIRFLFEEIETIAWALLQRGVLCRGGLTIGPLYHNGNVAFGPAFVEAYRLEEMIARHPRIVIGTNAFHDLQKISSKDETVRDLINAWFTRDGKGVAYIDILRPLRSEMASDDPDHIEMAKSRIALLREQLNKAISHVTDRPDVFAKYSWFVAIVNHAIYKAKLKNKTAFKDVEYINLFSLPSEYTLFNNEIFVGDF